MFERQDAKSFLSPTAFKQKLSVEVQREDGLGGPLSPFGLQIGILFSQRENGLCRDPFTFNKELNWASQNNKVGSRSPKQKVPNRKWWVDRPVYGSSVVFFTACRH